MRSSFSLRELICVLRVFIAWKKRDFYNDKGGFKRETITMEKFLVEISARHVHLCQKTVDVLFGEGHQLTPIKDLSARTVRLRRKGHRRRPKRQTYLPYLRPDQKRRPDRSFAD